MRDIKFRAWVKGHWIDCYDEEDGGYLFSIDIDGDVIYHK